MKEISPAKDGHIRTVKLGYEQLGTGKISNKILLLKSVTMGGGKNYLIFRDVIMDKPLIFRYEYSHEVDRMWRKTRSAGNGACRGVDPNRNWGHRWGGEGASTSPCAETYRGPRPFSEPETAAIRDFILARSSQIQVRLRNKLHALQY